MGEVLRLRFHLACQLDPFYCLGRCYRRCWRMKAKVIGVWAYVLKLLEQVHSIFSKIKEKVTRLRLSDCSELVKRTKFSVNKGQRIKSQSSGLKRAKICKKLGKRRKGDFSKKRPEKCEKKG